MKKSIVSMLGVAAIALSSTVFAHQGFYAGAAIGQSNTSTDTSALTSDNTQTSWKIFGGYDINNYLGVEAGYVDLGSPSYSYGSLGTANVDESATYIAAKGTLPLNDRFSLFGLIGPSWNHASPSGNGIFSGWNESRNHTDLMFGVGTDFAATKQISLRLEYQNFGKIGTANNGSDIKSDMWSLGAAYKF